MNKKFLLALYMVFVISAFAAENNIQVIEGEGIHYVNISLRDMNRISCPLEVGDPIYSKEKELEIGKYGKELFIKVSPRQATYPDGKKDITYSNMPRDLFVDCGGRIFSFVLIPKDIPSQTVTLHLPLVEIEAAKVTEASAPYEALLHKLIQHVYMDTPPDGYVMAPGKDRIEFRELTLNLRRTYTGYNYLVEDWIITSAMEGENEFNEQAFLPYLKKPRAVTLINPRLNKTEQTRLIVVRDK